MKIELNPIGFVQNQIRNKNFNNVSETISFIILKSDIPQDALIGIEDFSHLEIIWYFHKNIDKENFLIFPRGDKNLQKRGIFATRSPVRPNHIATTVVQLIDIEGHILSVKGLDALDGSPVLDIKPLTLKFLPDTPIIQPAWVGC